MTPLKKKRKKRKPRVIRDSFNGVINRSKRSIDDDLDKTFPKA